MTGPERLKREKHTLATRYARRDNRIATLQLLNTLVPYFALFYGAIVAIDISWWLTAACTGLLVLFTLRLFVLMHDCGHNSLFRSTLMNKLSGFLLGVLCGMPQYVWSRHHAYHHATNGNWSRFRGALGILSTDEFSRLSTAGQRRYQYSRSILVAPVAGFVYFIFNPRLTLVLGILQFPVYLLKSRLRHPQRSLREIAFGFTTRYWKDSREFLHMLLNNLALMALWVVAARHFGAGPFFAVYITSLSLAGAAGLVLFTVQHNFEASYASDDAHWDPYQAVLEGTSYLVLPKALNWFTADIAYHHVHHLSAQIPNYRLAKCHRENQHLFGKVRRLLLRDVIASMHFILWDVASRKIVSIRQYREQQQAAVT